MVGELVVKSVSVDPGDRIDVDPERVVHDRERLDEPLLVVEGAMGDPHVDHGGQVQPAEEPANHEVSGADQQARPGADRGRREGHAGQRIDEDDRVPDEVIALHEEPPFLPTVRWRVRRVYSQGRGPWAEGALTIALR